MRSFRILTALAIGLFCLPVLALPSLRGSITNLTDYPSDSLRVRVTWSCRRFGDGPSPSLCRPRSTEAPLIGGRFSTKPIVTPPVPLGYGEGVNISILAPGLEPVSAMTISLSDLGSRFLQLGFFQTNGALLPLRLRDGRDFREWVRTEAPARSVEIKYSLTVNGIHSLRDMNVSDFASDRIKFDTEYSAAPLTGNDKFENKLIVTVNPYGSMGAPLTVLFENRHVGGFNREFLSSLGELVLDLSGLNTNPTGKWAGMAYLHDLSRLTGKAYAVPKISLQARCIDQELKGKLTTTYKDDSPGRTQAQSYPISGECHNGYFKFRSTLALKRYLDPDFEKFTLEFTSQSISNHFLYATITSLHHGKSEAGAMALRRK